ncbi:hypothetical protein Sru01_37870 [Sphaerisporangium rufum]|uniref:BD-FAE-like domain-containing protein n=1 Tax=Sphaerisporangium rufum TaxID=1381558 RepID=A0A919R5S1_9ACTN|nr:alpha/beta hydrolase [Sphaerisporangium rufum]GII78805.1 hypothetical protein Sru01_37870 [Sphaerisporangium rufum]
MSSPQTGAAPRRRIPYGPHPDQWGELWPPAPAGGPPPVAVLVHGGYWRSVWEAGLMDALAADLAGRGFAAWSLEYRRPDRHGWAATTADVAAGLAAVAALPGVDRGRVAVVGHSAGGQLALRAAADDGRVALAVSLAGVLDLVEAHRHGLGSGAVAAALGGDPESLPQVYAAADPMARLPLGVPQLIVQCTEDDPGLVAVNRGYARAAGAEATYLERPGDHFAVIDPATPVWREVAAELAARLGPPAGPPVSPPPSG